MDKDTEKHSELGIFYCFPDVFVRKSKSFGQNIDKQATGKFSFLYQAFPSVPYGLMPFLLETNGKL